MTAIEVDDRVVLAAVRSMPEEADFSLVTVVATSGSTYRSAGALMVVTAAGESTGMISGGCLEVEVAALALEVMASGRAVTRRFDLTSADEAMLGWGLGCSGIVHVLVEPGPSARIVAGLHLAIDDAGVPGVLVSSMPGGDGVVRHGLRVGGRVLGDPSLNRDVTGGGTSGRPCFERTVEPALRLGIFGEGPDVDALHREAVRLGWCVTVCDRVAAVPVGAWAMIMTHDLQRDIALLVAMADDPPGWIGLLGPAARRDRVLDAVVARGVQVDGLRRVLHGPAGLDLGAEGAREIALSIIAQILATSRGRTGQPLSCRTGP